MKTLILLVLLLVLIYFATKHRQCNVENFKDENLVKLAVKSDSSERGDMPTGPSGVPLYVFPQDPYENYDFDELLRNQMHSRVVTELNGYETQIAPLNFVAEVDNWHMPEVGDIKTPFDKKMLREVALNNSILPDILTGVDFDSGQ